MHFPLFTTALLFLAPLTFALPSPSPNANLEIRQQQQAPIQTITCADYSRIANYTAINSNSSLRAAFPHAAPHGPRSHTRHPRSRLSGVHREESEVRSGAQCAVWESEYGGV
ncbi:hypothetical protein VE04_09417 [Pseudogymnoascus sp. 24MN13]|nr:hypothetical protein VE04_09417 [Pseudogymnoascus sp. 24MN13]